MIKINIPNNNINERKYIIDIIFNEFLGLNYKIELAREKTEDAKWIIELENDNKLIFEDYFFNKFPNDLEYLKVENTPASINYQPKTKNQYLLEDDIPIIYGCQKLEISKQQLKTITCGIDIFASSFFMLTRWEEYVNQNRDTHNRFPATESLAFKNNFLDRPVVNEYVEMLKNMLLELGLEQKLKTRNYQLYLTHDVDHIYKWNTIAKFLRHLAGDLLIRKSIKEFFSSIHYYAQIKLKKKNDPYDTFDYLMDISEKLKVKSYFFFMAKGVTSFDNRYKSSSKDVKKLLDKLKTRKHYIGIHPTYNAYNSYTQFKNEKVELAFNFNTDINFGREHYLRFEVPTTWQVWEDNNMEWDSTCGYADKEGFRCGICYEYSVFNILTRKKLQLKEKPLIVMEGSLINQQSMNPQNMQTTIKNLIVKVKKYNGNFVFLWHNSSFNTKEWRSYQHIYQKVLEKDV